MKLTILFLSLLAYCILWINWIEPVCSTAAGVAIC